MHGFPDRPYLNQMPLKRLRYLTTPRFCIWSARCETCRPSDRATSFQLGHPLHLLKIRHCFHIWLKKTPALRNTLSVSAIALSNSSQNITHAVVKFDFDVLVMRRGFTRLYRELSRSCDKVGVSGHKPPFFSVERITAIFQASLLSLCNAQPMNQQRLQVQATPQRSQMEAAHPYPRFDHTNYKLTQDGIGARPA